VNRIIYAVVALVALLPLPVLAQDTTNVSAEGSVFDALLNMSPIAAYMAICAIVLPFVIGIINRSKWSSTARLACTVVVCVVASFGWFLFKGEIVPVDKWLRLSLMIFLGATVMYKLFKPAVKEVEQATG
jgi:putative Mn2+ efflux pump MntP